MADQLTNTAYYESPIGIIQLVETDGFLTIVHFMRADEKQESTNNNSPVLQNTITQLDEYFAGSRHQFDLPLQAAGTAFQQTVWQQLLQIPFAEVITYLQLAKRLGNVKSIRAAASANGKNPLAIIIPCHRVIGANGQLTGYAGGLPRKQWLLEHEAAMAGKKSTLF